MHHLNNAFPLYFIFSAALNLGCCAPAEPTPPSPSLPEEVGSFLENIAANVLAPAHAGFAERAEALDTSLTSLVSAPEDTAAQAGAQDAWREAMRAWQTLEVLQIGPSGPSLTSIGGANLRDEIYSWPTVNPCRIDQEIVENQFSDDSYFTNNLVNSYGLDALEYLLFNRTLENQCRSLTNINASGSWDALTHTEIAERRARLGKGLTAAILAHAQQLSAVWAPTTGEYYHHFSAPNHDSIYDNYSNALNDLYRALFYVEKTVKDTKLGVPLGLVAPCDEGTPCPQRTESQWADYSREEIIANLESFQTVFRGTPDPHQDGIGFDDLLHKKGAGSVVEAIEDGITGALESLNSLNVSLQDALESDFETLLDAHTSLKTAMTHFKTEFADVLELEIPHEGAGDND